MITETPYEPRINKDGTTPRQFVSKSEFSLMPMHQDKDQAPKQLVSAFTPQTSQLSKHTYHNSHPAYPLSPLISMPTPRYGMNDVNGGVCWSKTGITMGLPSSPYIPQSLPGIYCNQQSLNSSYGLGLFPSTAGVGHARQIKDSLELSSTTAVCPTHLPHCSEGDDSVFLPSQGTPSSSTAIPGTGARWPVSGTNQLATTTAEPVFAVTMPSTTAVSTTSCVTSAIMYAGNEELFASTTTTTTVMMDNKDQKRKVPHGDRDVASAK